MWKRSLFLLIDLPSIKSDNYSKFLNRHPVKFAFIISHILSAGFNSGQYGGKNTRPILLGIFNAFDL